MFKKGGKLSGRISFGGFPSEKDNFFLICKAMLTKQMLGLFIPGAPEKKKAGEGRNTVGVGINLLKGLEDPPGRMMQLLARKTGDEEITFDGVLA